LWQQRQQQLGRFIDWELKGRLALRTVDHGDSASLIWKKSGDDQEIQLFGAFGGGRVRIIESAVGAVLRDGAGEEFRGLGAEEVLHRAIAWRVPFSELGYWVRGLPAPGQHEGIGFDHNGRVRQISQSGWEIKYLEYRTFNGLDLPYKIQIQALPGTVKALTEDIMEPSNLLLVKLAISYWNGEPEAE
jgi:outer membrane lipoprotein LolB